MVRAKIQVEIGDFGSRYQEDSMRRPVLVLVLLLGLPAALGAQAILDAARQFAQTGKTVDLPLAK
jgi:hypothetical protein